MLHDIPERFLRDPERARANLASQLVGHVVMEERHVQPMLLGQFPAEPRQRGHEAERLQDRRMELMGQPMDLFGDVARAVGDRAQLFAPLERER